MTLTPEQKERIRINRERALAIQKERREKIEQEKKRKKNNLNETKLHVDLSPSKKQKIDTVELEDFEVGASEWITKTEAMKIYCLPQGTLAICEVQERENPHNNKWKPMKLYTRSEVRERARKRFGGADGLVAERTKREQERLSKDMEKAKSIFK
jgi:DNA-repair protein complementing XP-A cells